MFRDVRALTSLEYSKKKKHNHKITDQVFLLSEKYKGRQEDSCARSLYGKTEEINDVNIGHLDPHCGRSAAEHLRYAVIRCLESFSGLFYES